MLCVFVFVACFPFLRFLFVFPAGHAVTETALRNDPDVNINGGRETRARAAWWRLCESDPFSTVWKLEMK